MDTSEATSITIQTIMCPANCTMIRSHTTFQEREERSEWALRTATVVVGFITFPLARSLLNNLFTPF